MELNADTLERFYLLAMQSGYAARAEYRRLEHEPHKKGWHFADPEEFPGLVLMDEYFVHPETKQSFGTTVIYANNVPAWQMSYAGHYVKEAIPFLKEALMAAYSSGEFRGGRGPSSYDDQDSGLAYVNAVSGMDTLFHEFFGYEEIRDSGAKRVGVHVYSGMCLIG